MRAGGGVGRFVHVCWHSADLVVVRCGHVVNYTYLRSEMTRIISLVENMVHSYCLLRTDQDDLYLTNIYLAHR